MKKWLEMLTAFLLAFGGSYALFAVPAFSDRVCPEASWIRDNSTVCEDKYDPVSTEEASRFLHDYYSAATRAGSPEAWNLLDEEFQQERFRGDESAFRASVSMNMWNELITSPTPGSRHNEFFVRIRYYQDDRLANGKPDPNGMIVNPLRQVVRLKKTPDGVRMVSEGHTKIDSGYAHERYAWAYLNGKADGHLLPTLNSAVADSAIADSVAAVTQKTSARLRALCQIKVPEGSAAAADSGWWTRTNKGWFKNTDLKSHGAALGIRACDSYVLGFL